MPEIWNQRQIMAAAFYTAIFFGLCAETALAWWMR